MLIKRATRNVLLTAALAHAALAASLFAAEQTADAVKRGQEVYTEQKCQLCHAIGGKGNKTNPLDGVGAKRSADEIREWITHPTAMSEKTNSTKKPPMPAKYGSLPAADIDALVAYLQSLK
jgi:mono/diheme cytochrome c family protein